MPSGRNATSGPSSAPIFDPAGIRGRRQIDMGGDEFDLPPFHIHEWVWDLIESPGYPVGRRLRLTSATVVVEATGGDSIVFAINVNGVVADTFVVSTAGLWVHPTSLELVPGDVVTMEILDAGDGNLYNFLVVLRATVGTPAPVPEPEPEPEPEPTPEPASVGFEMAPVAMAFDGTDIWILGFDYFLGTNLFGVVLARYDRGTEAVTLYGIAPTVLGGAAHDYFPESLLFDGTYLWAVGGGPTGWVVRVDPAAPDGDDAFGDIDSASMIGGAFDGTNVWTLAVNGATVLGEALRWNSDGTFTRFTQPDYSGGTPRVIGADTTGPVIGTSTDQFATIDEGTGDWNYETVGDIRTPLGFDGTYIWGIGGTNPDAVRWQRGSGVISTTDLNDDDAGQATYLDFDGTRVWFSTGDPERTVVLLRRSNLTTTIFSSAELPVVAGVFDGTTMFTVTSNTSVAVYEATIERW